MKFSLILILFLNIGIVLNHACGTDKLKLNLNSLKVPSKEKRIAKLSKLNAGNYEPIKIGYDFSTLNKPSSMSNTIFNNIKSLLQETREYISKFLQVVHQNIDISDYFNDIIDVCEVSYIGSDYSNFLVKNDLIIWPFFEDFDEGVIAAAAPCLIEYETMRPIGGILYINKKLDFNIQNAEIYMKNILIHEITHILVFHPFFFYNLDLIGTRGSINYISSPKVLEQARKHFGCDNLRGIVLEDQGGVGSIGSHWESRYMLGDYMISTNYPDVAISDITLALFEDSGFYKVNYYSGGLFKFGKGAGCRFFNDKCVLNDEAQFTDFCAVSSKPLCSSSRALKSSCFMGRYPSIPSKYAYFSDKNIGGYSSANYCPVAYETHPDNDYFPKHCQFGSESSNYGEKLGPNSFCFMSSIVDGSSNDSDDKPVCYEIECDRSNKKIIVKIGSSRVECPNGGGSVNAPSGMKGTIDCPEYSDLCSSNDIVCNDMYSCFTKIAKNEKYNYETSPYNYEGSTYTSDTKDEYIEPIRRSESFNLRMNLLLIAAICLFSLI